MKNGMNFLTIEKSKIAIKLEFNDDKMTVYCQDSRELAIPLEWFPRLRSASREQLLNYRFIGEGEGIHWEDLDEDILVDNLF